MVTIYFKTREIVQVASEELEDFIYANKEKIQPIRVQRRGERRSVIPISNDAASISSR